MGRPEAPACEIREVVGEKGCRIKEPQRESSATANRVALERIIAVPAGPLRGCEVFGRAPKWPSQFHWRHRIGRNQMASFRP